MEKKLLYPLRIKAERTAYMIVFLVASLASITLQASDTSREVTLIKDSAKLIEVFADIETQTGLNFFYNNNLVDTEQRVSVRLRKVSLQTALDVLFKNTSITYSFSDNYIVLKATAENPDKSQAIVGKLDTTTEDLSPLLGVSSVMEEYKINTAPSPAQLVSGKITDEQGQPLPGVNVLEKGTTNGTSTDAGGLFTVNVAGSESVLIFSFIGYLTQEVVVGNQTTVNISLQPDLRTLEEVVVVGYGTQKRSDLTGAISSIKPDEAKRAVTTSFDQLIQGRAAGVTVSQNSAAPGGSLTIRIRGTNSISGGNDPLFVVDGVPLDNGNNSNSDNRVTDGESDYIGSANPEVNSLSAINPNDIESIEILKDASATAIYGARGANGVILVTTKRGKSGESTIDFNLSYGFQQVTNRYDMLNAQQFMELNNEARRNSNPSLTTYFNPANVRFDTDWQEELFRTAATQNYQVAFRGGSDKTRYSLSANYFDQEGIVKGSGLTRYALRLNLDGDVGRKLKFGTNLNLSRNETNQVLSDDNYSIVKSALKMVPNQPVIYNGIYSNNEDDSFNADLDLNLNEAGVSYQEKSPMYNAEKVLNRLYSNRVLGSLFGEYSIIKDLSFRSSLSADLIDSRGEFYEPTNGDIRNTGGAAQINYSTVISLLIENTLNYNKVWGNHTFSGVIGQTAQQYQYDRLKVMAESLNDNTTIYNFSGDSRVNNDKYPDAYKWTMLSFLGRINYGYQGKYLATASFRADGSSRFGGNNKFGYFPSISAAWVMTREDFLQDVQALSTLKLRVGYGVTGSQEIGLYNSLSTLSDVRFILNDVLASGKEPGRIPNPDLTWESTQQTNIGLDFGLLNDRLYGSANYYYKLTEDLLYNRNLSGVTGFDNVTQNIGSVSNRGWELELGTRTDISDLQWNASLNLSYNKNRIEELTGLGEDESYISNDFLLKKGVALGSFYGYLTDGIFQTDAEVAASAQTGASPGDRKYKDVNLDNEINGNDRVILGNTQPKYTYGFTNSFAYKGINLSIFFQGVSGNKIYNITKIDLESVDGRINNSTAVLDRWTPENQSNAVPRAQQSGRSSYASTLNDYFVESGTFFRLKNVTLSYDLPKALLQPLKVRTLRLSFSADNLWTSTDYTGFNPDISGYDNGAYPLAKSYNLALNFQF